MLKLGIIGAGTVGTALSVRLNQKGYPVVAVSSRSRTSAEKLALRISGCQPVDNNQTVADLAEVVFITTPDGAIPAVVRQQSLECGEVMARSVQLDDLAQERLASVADILDVQDAVEPQNA